MRKLTVDEIIGGLIEAYEKLLMVMSDTESSVGEYHHAIGEVKALRWVLGQEHQCSLDSSMPDEEENDNDNV